MLTALKLHRPGLGFYAIRHTFETVGGASKDQVSVNAIMGTSIRRWRGTTGSISTMSGSWPSSITFGGGCSARSEVRNETRAYSIVRRLVRGNRREAGA